jgi:hypothetical protein
MSQDGNEARSSQILANKIIMSYGWMTLGLGQAGLYGVFEQRYGIWAKAKPRSPGAFVNASLTHVQLLLAESTFHLANSAHALAATRRTS